MKTCPCPCGCQAKADNLEEKERIFGYRGKIIQSYCKKCRGPHNGIEYQENINPIFNVILHGKLYDSDQTKNFYSQIPRFDKDGKYITFDKKNRLTAEYLLNKHKESINNFLKLLDEPEPQIEEERFMELFKMYNFKIARAEKQDDFFKFRIFTNGNTESTYESKNIFVILKIYQTISEAFIKILSVKLKDSSAILITLVNNNPLDFDYDNFKICILDRELIKCLLLYRINEIPIKNIHELFSQAGKL